MRTVIIRRASADDVTAIVQVSLTSASTEEMIGFAAPEWVTYSSPSELKKLRNRGNRLKDGSEVLVAEKERRIVGFIVFKMERDCVYIDNIDITKDEQRKGVGRTLFTQVENRALTKGCSRIKTDTTENARGNPWRGYWFWIRMGYEDTRERLSTKWNFKTITLVKNLK